MTSIRQALLGVLLTISIFCVAGAASAQCADPANSTFPAHVVLCPRGDLPVLGRVLDVNGNACAGTNISMVFRGPAASSLYVAASYPFPAANAVTRPTGEVVWWPRVSGCEMGGGVSFVEAASGTALGQALTINSPDLDGDGQVALSDLVLFTAAYNGAYSRCADFDVNGVVDLADLVVFSAHYGH